MIIKGMWDVLQDPKNFEGFILIGGVARWGVPFTKYVSSDVRNLAANGRSARAFLREGNWANILRQVETGDFVIISFGHSDQGNPWDDEGAPVCASK
jgi:lysophospholipase L1-like esterase